MKLPVSLSCRLVELPRIDDVRGSLSFVESEKHIPFDIKRVYYLYDVPENAERGGHAHKKLHQLMLPISGSFDVCIDDGYKKEVYHLSEPHIGLYIPPMKWRDLRSFSDHACCVVLASEYYTEEDYFRDYNEFISHVK